MLEKYSWLFGPGLGLGGGSYSAKKRRARSASAAPEAARVVELADLSVAEWLELVDVVLDENRELIHRLR